MEMQVALVLLSMFFTKALALECYGCRDHDLACPSRMTLDCSEECNSITAALSLGGVQMDYSTRICTSSPFCVSGRINTGSIKATINSKCCRTDYCNDQDMPALPKQPLNGKKCCANNICSETVSCEGDEDRCFNGTVVSGFHKVALKGCASRSICDGLVSISPYADGLAVHARCCEGNLCNTAVGFDLSLLIMLGALLIFILIH